MQPLRLAFVGGYGHHYLRGALGDPDVQVEAVAVVSDEVDAEATRGHFARELAAGAQWFDSVAEMIERFRPTVVNVGGVYGRQWEPACAALRAGVPVVCDKPVAASWEALEEVRRAAQGQTLVTEFDMRARQSFRAAAHAIGRGLIGDVVLATAQKSYRFGESRPDFYRRREDYGSTMLWVASHGIDAIAFTTGLRFTSVTGLHGNLSKPGYGQFEDHCVAMFTLERDAAGVVHADYLRPAGATTHGDDRLRVAGSLGVVEVRDNRCRLITHDGPERDITEDAAPLPTHRALLDAVFLGDTHLFSTAHSLEIAAVLLAARDAADRRERVTIQV